MDLAKGLYETERELAAGDGGTYRRHLTEDAVVLVPGQAMSKEETAQAMDASPGWDDWTFEEELLTTLTADSALLTYRFRGRRGKDFNYSALMGSVYVRRDGRWRMAFHQQTPLT